MRNSHCGQPYDFTQGFTTCVLSPFICKMIAFITQNSMKKGIKNMERFSKITTKQRSTHKELILFFYWTTQREFGGYSKVQNSVSLY